MILRYIDDAGLRRQVQKMLNSIENSNKFSKEIRFGNNGKLFRVNKVDLDIAEGCRRLIQNSIIYYNYSLLTSIIQDLPTSQKEKALETIKHGSPMCWIHINFRGKYDFENIPQPIELKSDQIRGFRLN